MDYILGIDQSTQGTKALLFDNRGELICRTDLSHRQIVNGKGWVEHDGEEIYRNTVQAVKDLVEKAGLTNPGLRAGYQQPEGNRHCLEPGDRKAHIQCSGMAVRQRRVHYR